MNLKYQNQNQEGISEIDIKSFNGFECMSGSFQSVFVVVIYTSTFVKYKQSIQNMAVYDTI